MKLFIYNQNYVHSFYVIELEPSKIGFYFTLDSTDYNYKYYPRRYEQGSSSFFTGEDDRYTLLIEGDKEDIENKLKKMSVLEELGK